MRSICETHFITVKISKNAHRDTRMRTPPSHMKKTLRRSTTLSMTYDRNRIMIIYLIWSSRKSWKPFTSILFASVKNYWLNKTRGKKKMYNNNKSFAGSTSDVIDQWKCWILFSKLTENKTRMKFYFVFQIGFDEFLTYQNSRIERSECTELHK